METDGWRVVRIFQDGDHVFVQHQNGHVNRFVYRPDLPEGDYYGNCPKCWEDDRVFSTDGYLFGPECSNWFICVRHKLKWYVGAGLFSAWQFMTEEELLVHEYRLREFREVEEVSDYRNTAWYMENKRLGRDLFSLPELVGEMIEAAEKGGIWK